MDPRAAWGVLPIVPLAILSALHPHWAFELAGVTGLLVGAWLALIWRRSSREAISGAPGSRDRRPAP